MKDMHLSSSSTPERACMWFFRKRAKKSKIFENLGKNIQDLKIFWKKGRWLCAIKLLEKDPVFKKNESTPRIGFYKPQIE